MKKNNLKVLQNALSRDEMRVVQGGRVIGGGSCVSAPDCPTKCSDGFFCSSCFTCTGGIPPKEFSQN